MAGKGIYRAKRMKATARHPEGPQAGRGNRDPFPEFEVDPKGIRGISGTKPSSVIGGCIRILARP
jgi:hypothetical protein